MKLIVGLGNPGSTYQTTRHNTGFMFVDWLVEANENAQLQNSKFPPSLKLRRASKIDKYLESEIVEIQLKNKTVILAKPLTFMNESGRAVKKLVTNYQLPITNNLYVVHDDLDIQLGQFKIQKGVGPRLHNGIASIENHLKTKDFWRVRIGVDNRSPDQRIPGEAYVLQNFTQEESKILKEVFSKINLINS